MIKEEPPKWFSDFQDEEKEKITNLPEKEIYGKGVLSIMEVDNLDIKSTVDYRVKTIDKNIELYTLKESFGVNSINFLLNNILNSKLLPESKSKLDAIVWSNIKTGLIAYVQPKITDSGELEEQILEIESNLESGNSFDIIVLIVKTGAKLSYSHYYGSEKNNSFLGRKFIVVCEEDSSVNINEIFSTNKFCNISHDLVALLSANSNISYNDTIESVLSLKTNKQISLIGEGSSASIETIGSASHMSNFEVINSIRVSSSMCHGVINSAFIIKDNSRLVYQSGVVSESDLNDFVDESKILFIGENARVEELPVRNSSNKRQITKTYMDNIDSDEVYKFFNRILDINKINKLLK